MKIKKYLSCHHLVMIFSKIPKNWWGFHPLYNPTRQPTIQPKSKKHTHTHTHTHAPGTSHQQPRRTCAGCHPQDLKTSRLSAKAGFQIGDTDGLTLLSQTIYMGRGRIFTDPRMVAFNFLYSKCIGKYTIVPWILWDWMLGTPPETNRSWDLKNGAWKTIVSFWVSALFSGAKLLVWRERILP